MMGVNNNTTRILLVGRDICQLNELSGYLRTPAVECETVMDIQTARQVLSCRCMNVIVIDSLLEDSDNVRMKRLLESIRSSFGRTKIVVFNGVRDRTLQRRLRRRGAAGYLSDRNNMKNVALSVQRLMAGG